jgi:hypothetical protein
MVQGRIMDSYNGITIGTWADTVLEKMSQPMTRAPEIVGNNPDPEVAGLVVKWHYPDVVFTIARGYTDHPVYGRISVYAVQAIEAIT